MIVVDEVALDRDRILLHGILHEDGAATAAGIVPEHIAFDPARDIAQRNAAAGELFVRTFVVVNVVVGDLEALRS